MQTIIQLDELAMENITSKSVEWLSKLVFFLLFLVSFIFYGSIENPKGFFNNWTYSDIKNYTFNTFAMIRICNLFVSFRDLIDTEKARMFNVDEVVEQLLKEFSFQSLNTLRVEIQDSSPNHWLSCRYLKGSTLANKPFT